MNESGKKLIKLEHYKNLVAVAFADGHFDEHELEFLSEKALEYGLSKKQVDEVMAKKDMLEFVVPFNQVDKEEQLTDVIYMAMVDGQVHEKEYGLCLAIAEKLDFEKNYLDQTIALVTKLNSFD